MDFRPLIDTWRGPLIGLIASWGAPVADACDIASDALAEAYVHRARFEGDWDDPDAAGPWLRGIARNLHRTWARDRKKRRSEDIATVDVVADAEPDALESNAVVIRQEIDRLEDAHREVLLMFYFDKTSQREVAALLGISVRAVEGRLYKARAVLRQRLDARADELEIRR